MNKLSAEEIQNNWNTFLAFSKKIGDNRDRQNKISAMLDKYDERFALAPASSKISHHNAFPGGLVDHSLRVLKYALAVSKMLSFNVSNESLIFSALFHDLGKIGDDKESYYIDQDSDWHREKQGAVYKINDKIQFMPTAQRSIYLLQLNEIVMTQDEFVAILIHDGLHCKENEVWSLREPGLATILHQADYLAMKKEKGEL